MSAIFCAVLVPYVHSRKVSDLGVDMLTIVGHKFGAPKGVAALYVREGIALPPMVHGGGQEAGRRAGTENVLLISGMGKAAEVRFVFYFSGGGGARFTAELNNLLLGPCLFPRRFQTSIVHCCCAWASSNRWSCKRENAVETVSGGRRNEGAYTVMISLKCGHTVVMFVWPHPSPGTDLCVWWSVS